MAEVKWIKLCVDIFDHRKLRYLRKLPEGNNIALIWIMLLCLAGRCNSGGVIFLTECIPYTPKMLADELGFDENTVLFALSSLSSLNMISYDEDCICVTNWSKYQTIDRESIIREQTRKRVAEYRERLRLQAGNASAAQRNVTGNATVTQCNALRKKKEEEIEEKEREQEFQPIDHSYAVGEEEVEDISPPDESPEGLSRRLRYIKDEICGGIVMLTEEQDDDLLRRLSLDEYEKYVGIIRDCELKGKHFKKKTHYQAILEMVEKDRRVKR